MRIALVGAPDGFERAVGALSEGASFTRTARTRCELAVLFVTSKRDLLRKLDGASNRAGGDVWVCWPKQSSGVDTDIGEQFVRATGLARGLVDYKIAAIDATWSALR